MANLLDARYKSEVDAMYDHLASFWESNVKRFFSKTEKNYPELEGKYRHYVAWRSAQGNRLTNALVITHKDNGKVSIGAKEILVPLRGGNKYTDLVEYLRLGTNPSVGRYIRWADYRLSRDDMTDDERKRYMKRGRKALPERIGFRGGTTGQQWSIWWTIFMQEVDTQLEILADKCVGFVEDDVVKLMESEF